ncbi:hypothetical protein [Streptomyces sp. AC495_CC817]|uniref:hypothetical protein n=1 Tax=Streptomyces sp. AC495_CC817 TaxID=2823900 RepID=UPI001C25FAAA|nr:hypothetical protein [Streptomyces sp. AC495_CC817]
MSGQTWTPAPKKGIIPLHPLTFGMLLGKSFAALRHNPKVLFGFGVVIQLVVVLVSTAVMGFVLVATFSRLMTVSPASPDFEAVFAGTIAMNLVAGIAVGLASVAFTALMQGVVAAEVGYAAIGVKATLGTLWRRMIPAFWRLAAFSAMFLLLIFGVVIIVFGIVAALVAGGVGGTEIIGIAILITVLLVIASIPLTVWISTKLLLVPSILVLERATFREALVRSWRLTRGRFWVAFGVTALIGVIMGLAMQVVSLPVALISSLLGTIIAPTGSSDPAAIMGYVFALLAPQALLLVLQAISLVVQSTGGVLVYLDCRMRYEGLDQTLIGHVERRDLGWTEDQLGDPYVVDPARAVTSAPPVPQTPAPYGYAPQGYAPQGYAPQGYAPQGYAPQGYAAAPPAPSPYPGHTPGAPSAYGAQQPSTPPAPAYAPPAHGTASGSTPAPPPAPAPEQTDDPWAAPGSEGRA